MSVTQEHLRTDVFGVTVEQVRTDEDVWDARRLHADVYLERHYVEPPDLRGGVLSADVDPWAGISTYFIARDHHRHPVGVGRQIQFDDPGRLPAMSLSNLDDVARRHVLRQGGHAVVEISALAVRRRAPRFTSLALYAAMWARSIEQEHTAWVMAIHPSLARSIVGSLGPVISPLGPPQWFMGSDVIPGIIWTDRGAGIVACAAAGHKLAPLRARLPELFPENPTERRP